jgi:hypothetical protein
VVGDRFLVGVADHNGWFLGGYCSYTMLYCVDVGKYV